MGEKDFRNGEASKKLGCVNLSERKNRMAGQEAVFEPPKFISVEQGVSAVGIVEDLATRQDVIPYLYGVHPMISPGVLKRLMTRTVAAAIGGDWDNDQPVVSLLNHASWLPAPVPAVGGLIICAILGFRGDNVIVDGLITGDLGNILAHEELEYTMVRSKNISCII